MKTRLLIIHGPNLNLLGTREVDIYGHLTLSEINTRIKQFAKQNRAEVRVFQSNSEGALIDFIHKNRKWAQGIVINPAAYTHYSYALLDALQAVALPAIEVHLSDTDRRESFRRKSVTKAACLKQISGLGWASYIEGMRALLNHLATG